MVSLQETSHRTEERTKRNPLRTISFQLTRATIDMDVGKLLIIIGKLGLVKRWIGAHHSRWTRTKQKSWIAGQRAVEHYSNDFSPGEHRSVIVAKSTFPKDLHRESRQRTCCVHAVLLQCDSIHRTKTQAVINLRSADAPRVSGTKLRKK